jgi:hypothetical protein
MVNGLMVNSMTSAIDKHVSLDATLVAQFSTMVHGLNFTMLLYVVAKLGIADLLKDGGRTVDELAEATGTLSHRLYRILRALVSLGIFSQDRPRYFTLTPMGQLLRSDWKNSCRDFLIMQGSEWHVRGWANILHCLQADESALKGVFGLNLFEYLHKDPHAAATFDHAMTAASIRQAAAVCEAYDFSDLHTIVDVGGGQGILLRRILKSFSSLQGILFDQPEVVKDVVDAVRAESLGDRCQVIHGNFLHEPLPKADGFILKYILHDWGDGEAERILQNCRRSIESQGRIIVIDAVIQGAAPWTQTVVDIEMMTMTSSGLERTAEEFRILFSGAGFKVTKIIPTRSGLSIVEGIPV